MDALHSVIATYIKPFPSDVSDRLISIHKLILSLAPDVTISFSYGMPAYHLEKKPLIYIAGYSKHIGIYATPEANRHFAGRLSKYKTGRGSIQLPNDKPLPIALIKRIVLFKRKSILSARSKPKK